MQQMRQEIFESLGQESRGYKFKDLFVDGQNVEMQEWLGRGSVRSKY